MEGRPDPDKLLKQYELNEESFSRGRLKIFLGYSAGVGKTYKMLETAHSRQRQGVDVIIGYVDTHGRAETDALLKGLPVVPRKQVDYRGITISEMDLDAIIARKPQLVLVDEFAHTNPPSFRHKKRYEDVQEILKAGIDVYTTLNIQHIESFKDLIIGMTGILVKETVPDQILDEANEIELVDLPPIELIQRFREGKIYMGDQASQALENFFTPGNLVGLREMALRSTTQRVQRDIQTFTQAGIIKPKTPISGQILVCVSGNRTMGERVVRTCRRLADELKTHWVALFVDTSALDWKTRNERDQALKTLQLAKSLGADTVVLQGKSIAETVVEYAFNNNIARIVVGKPIRSRWQELIFGSNSEEIIRLSGWIEITLVMEENPPETKKSIFSHVTGRKFSPYFGTAIIITAVTLLNYLVQLSGINSGFAILFLFAIVVTAVVWGKGPGFFASITSAFFYFFFFIFTPYSSLNTNLQDMAIFCIYLAVGFIISWLVTRKYVQVEYLKTQAGQLANLYEFIRDLAAASNLGVISKIIVQHVERVFHWNASVLIPHNNVLIVRYASPGMELDEKELSIALWTYNQGATAGFQSETLSMSKKQFLPFTTERGVVGVIGIQPTFQVHSEEFQQDRFMQIFIDQAAWAIERAQLLG